MSLAQTNQTDVQALGSQTPTLAKRNGKGANPFRKQNRTGSSFKGSVKGMN